MPLMTELNMEIKGRDLNTGYPRSVVVTSSQIQKAMENSIAEIIDVSQVQVARLLKKNLEKLRVRIIRECFFDKRSSSYMVNIRK